MYIKRDLEKKFEKLVNLKEIVAIIGPRQAGKTTLTNHILDKIKNKKITKISFENVEDRGLFETNIEEFINLYVKNTQILFIDEIQYVKNSGQKLKYIFDNYTTKLIISGSSATEISINSIKYLVGRIFVLELQTLSFSEFLRFKDENLYLINKDKTKYSEIILNKLNRYLDEYLLYGGYPRVVLMEDIEIKIEVLKNIYNTYLLKEIKEILEYKENYKISKLIKVLSIQLGGIANYEDLCSKSDMTYKELKEVISILEKTYILKLILPYYTNKLTEITKSPKIYFYDLGFRNYAMGRFEKPIDASLYENFVACETIRKELEIKFWRNKSKSEVDFIIEKGTKILPIEVKSSLKKDVVERSFRSFLEKYKPERGIICSTNFSKERKISDTKVNFIYFVNFVNYLNEF